MEMNNNTTIVAFDATKCRCTEETHEYKIIFEGISVQMDDGSLLFNEGGSDSLHVIRCNVCGGVKRYVLGRRDKINREKVPTGRVMSESLEIKSIKVDWKALGEALFGEGGN